MTFKVLCVSVHRYQALAVHGIHEMEFSESARVDDMLKRVVSPGEMTETFQNRSDFLCYRHTVFSRNVQFSESKNAEPNIYLQKVNGKSGYALSEGKRGYRISTYITNETGGQTGSSTEQYLQ